MSCLVIVTTDPKALPHPVWQHPNCGPMPEVFGYQTKYFNPAKTMGWFWIDEVCVGFYEVSPTNFFQDFTCEVSREKVKWIMAVEGDIKSAKELYRLGGISAVKKAAIKIMRPNVSHTLHVLPVAA